MLDKEIRTAIENINIAHQRPELDESYYRGYLDGLIKRKLTKLLEELLIAKGEG